MSQLSNWWVYQQLENNNAWNKKKTFQARQAFQKQKQDFSTDEQVNRLMNKAS